MSVALLETDLGIEPPPEIIIPPSHPVPLKEVGVFIPAQNHHDLSNEGNESGYNNELKTGRLLSEIDFVKEVRQVEPFSQEDRELIDLVVTMVDGYPVEFVFVQVKSGQSGGYEFFDMIGRRIDEEDKRKGVERDKSDGSLEYQRRREWMKSRRLMLINAGTKKSGPVSDDYIREKFMREVEGIIEYES